MTISQLLDEAYNKHKIIPEVVDQFDTQGLLTIEYGQKDQVTLGNTLTVDGTQEKPKIQFTLNLPNLEAELLVKEDDKFLLVLTDPDAPSNTDHKWSQYCHWIVSDLKLNSNNSEGADSLSTILDFSKATDLVSYQAGPSTRRQVSTVMCFCSTSKTLTLTWLHLQTDPRGERWCQVPELRNGLRSTAARASCLQ